jgi:hypothetical protein
MSDTENSGSKTLKGRNLAWLVATLVLDCLVLLVLAFPTAVDELTLTRLAAIRGSLTALLPIPALIISSLISADAKAVLVFWRIKHPLPGSRAFSVHAPADHRIDLEQLKKHVGEFPVDERDQNAKWYRLYKQVGSDPSVADSHKNYLLFRDIAAMSLILTLAVPATMTFIGVSRAPILICAGWFLCQYFVSAFSAKNTGIRFVQNVLAVHASRGVNESVTSKFTSVGE